MIPPIPATPDFPMALPSKFNVKAPKGGGNHLGVMEDLSGEEKATSFQLL